MRRRDRRRVEAGDRADEIAMARADLCGRSAGEQRHDLVEVGRRRAGEAAGEALLGVDEALADAVAQLAGRHARERHEQDLVKRRALGDVARGERGDGERLAGPRARLEHRDAGRQRSPEVKRRGSADAAHRSITSSTASRSPHTRRA